ncbi:MAG: clostripain-related cysteine peptidase [Alistipes senegalensis]|nr:clostripain-related cysteine peptidase [Bacteroides cellulosilyticus]MCM1352059.1 clostripain-related cysteine peptidase [Alistipes senegalensis]
MISRQLLFFLSVVLLCAGCEKERPSVLQISQPSVLLPNESGAVATIDIVTDGAWSAVVDGDAFTVTPMRGNAGRTQVSVATSNRNTQEKRQILGTVQFVLDGSSSVFTTIEISQRAVTASHTLLLYMFGRSLLSYYEKNIAGIERAVTSEIPGDGRILVCYQPEAYDKATLLEIFYDAEKQQCVHEPLKTYDEFRAEDTASVRRMFADVYDEAPAESYGLALGCHGFGWVPAGSELQRNAYSMERPLPGALMTRTATRFLGDTGHQIDIAQLADAVAGLSYRFGYLIFDDCFMANIETLYDLRRSFDYIVASPCEVMAAGFPYDRTIPYLFAAETPDLPRVCREFWNFYEKDWNTVPNNAQSGCISLAVMSELEALAETVSAIHAGPTDPYDATRLQYYEGLTSHVFYDLDDYIRTICTDPALYDSFEKQLARAFPTDCRYHTASFYSAYNRRLNPITTYSGVTTSEPSKQFTDQHKETSWYRRTYGLE